MALSDHHNKKSGFPLLPTNKNDLFTTQRTFQPDFSSVPNVATPSPPVAPLPPQTSETAGERHHPAWTSIPQERWEGELHVQGQIPSWLVRIYAHTYFFVNWSSILPITHIITNN